MPIESNAIFNQLLFPALFPPLLLKPPRCVHGMLSHPVTDVNIFHPCKLSFMTVPPSRNCRVLYYVVTLATVNLHEFKSCLFLDKVQTPCLQLWRRQSYNTRGSCQLYVKHMLSPQHSPINEWNAKQFKLGKCAPVSEGKQNKIKQQESNYVIWSQKDSFSKLKQMIHKNEFHFL